MGGCMEFLKDLWHIRKLIIIILTPCVLVPFLVVDNGSQKVKCAYVMLMMGVFWVTEALPLTVTALIPVVLFPLLDLLSVKETSQQYINDMNMILVGVLICAAAIEKWNLHSRLALKILSWMGSQPRWILLGLMLPTWFLSLWICNLAAVGLTLPIGNAIINNLKGSEQREKRRPNPYDNPGVELDAGVEQKTLCSKGQNYLTSSISNGTRHVRSSCSGQVVEMEEYDSEEDVYYQRMRKAFILGITYAASIGGIGTMTGAATNLAMMGALQKIYTKHKITELPVDFAKWMGFGVPFSLVFTLIAWCWLQIIFLRCRNCCVSIDKEQAERVKSFIRNEYSKLGPISFGQVATCIHFLLLGVLWITRDMGGEYGWAHHFTKDFAGDAVASILIAILLFIFPATIPRIFCRRPFGEREQYKPLLTWHEAVHKVPWGIIFLLGGGFALAHVAKTSGLSMWVGQQLKNGLGDVEPWLLSLVLCCIVAACTEFIMNMPVVMLLVPIIGELAISLQLHPLYLMFPTGLAASLAFMLPAATPPNAVAFSYGGITVCDMILSGFVMNVIGVLLLLGFNESLADALFNYGDLPPELIIKFNNTG